MQILLDDISLALLSQSEFEPALLHDQERELVQEARSPSRVVEFGLGRAAARKALRGLGDDASSQITIGERGEPLWPQGIVGSISHTTILDHSERGSALDNIFAVSAVAHSAKVWALGVDLESITRHISPKVADRICTPSERQWIESGTAAPTVPSTEHTSMNQGSPFERLRLQDFSFDNDRALAIFLCKEAVFKVLSPWVKTPIGFKEAELRIQPDGITLHLSDRLTSLIRENSALSFEIVRAGVLYVGLVKGTCSRRKID